MYEINSYVIASCWPPPPMPQTYGLGSAETLHQAYGTARHTAEYILTVLTAWQY